uniref:ubiquitinyl hydrolase 1 n=1 Tax=Plectus sambesii TaxID=2011161 RepID=A0A914XJT3_9BILA
MTSKRIRLRTTSSSADQQPSVSHCDHVGVCHKLSYWELIEQKKKSCHECSFVGKNRWLCLTDSCKLVFCGSSGDDHSGKHSSESSGHNLMLNLNNWRVWCHSCEGEVYPDRNIPSWSAGEGLLSSEGIAKLKAADVAGPLAKLVQNDKHQTAVPQVHQSSSTAPVIGRAYNERGEFNLAQCQEIDDEADDRSPRGLTGLQNLGNTCYANAALQSLSNCAQLREFFNEHLSEPKSVTGSEPGVCKAFHMLLKTIWSPSRPGYASPRMLLNCVRTIYPQFRGWAQQDSQEFIRCFLDLMHRELRQPVYEWEQRDGATIDEAPPRRHSVSSSESDRSSVGSDNFETADSGWSSDGDGKTVIRPRRRQRTNSPSVGEMQADRRPKSPSSTTPVTKVRHPPSKVPKQRPPERYRSLITEVFDGRIQSTVQCLTCRHVSDTTETFQDLSLPIPSKDQIDRLMATYAQHDSAYGSTESLASQNGGGQQQGWILWLMYGWMGSLWNYVSGPTVTLRDCLNAFFSPDDLRGDDMYSCEKCAKSVFHFFFNRAINYLI